jgi:hypothetical protein
MLAALLMAPLTLSAAAIADDAKPQLTVEQCINILGGLNSLGYVGQSLNDTSRPPADAKQYKLGAARMTVALDISVLTPVLTAAQNAQQGFLRELPPLPPVDPKKPDSPERADAVAARNNAAAANWQAIIQKSCPVQVVHIKASDLKIGDGPDENAFPPTVLGTIWPIIDR